MSALVATSRMPSGNDPLSQLKTLQEVIFSSMPWARRLLQQSTTRKLDKYSFDHFVQLLIAALYCTSPQGRIESIVHILLSETEEWIRDGFMTSTRFKTANSFG